jgi:hypothetical protein
MMFATRYDFSRILWRRSRSEVSAPAAILHTPHPVHASLRLLSGEAAQPISESYHEVLGQPVRAGIRNTVACHIPVDVRRLLENIIG